jgi:Gametolysin peptidase M11
MAFGNAGPPLVAPEREAAARQTRTETGIVEQVTVRRAGAIATHLFLRRSDGSGIELRGWGPDAPEVGKAIVVTGRVSRDTLFADTVVPAPTQYPNKAAAPIDAQIRVEGTLELLHADNFDRDTAWLIHTVVDESGRRTEIDFATLPAELKKGMRIAVTGVAVASGGPVRPHDVEVLADAPSHDKLIPKISGTSKVLMILLKFTDTASAPYTVAQAQGTLATDPWSVANFYRDNSYGSHTLNGTVTNWLTASFATPATCNFITIGYEGNRLAQAAGYVLSQYNRIVYLFTSVPACGWNGLGEIGGTHAWVNQSLGVLVVGHELGHTFGLGHASAAICDTPVHHAIGGPCTNSEYGDPADIMGNSRAAHFNAAHKAALNYLPAGTVLTHTTGTAAYTLSPIESGGPAPLAVKILSAAMRTYWIEFRQPLGFDLQVGIPTGIATGAYVHLGGANEYDCDTCVLDMTPTATFDDAALPAGQQFVDTTTGTTVTVQTASGGALAVSVATPTRPSFGDVPPSYGAYGHIEAVSWNLVDRGCSQSPPLFCPNTPMTRGDFAIMLERAEHGTNFAFMASGKVFADVPESHPAAAYIEQLYKDGLTKGCAQSPLRFCPDDPIQRWEAAIFLVRARHGGAFIPSAPTGTIFADEPVTDPTAAWAEQLFRDGITQGCMQNPRRFCPSNGVIRADAAIFLQRTYLLSAPPP